MTKPIILVKICYNCVSFKELKYFNKVTSWPQLISNLWLRLPVCNVASDWPRTFFTPQVFLFSISLLFVNKYHYLIGAYKQMLF